MILMKIISEMSQIHLSMSDEEIIDSLPPCERLIHYMKPLTPLSAFKCTMCIVECLESQCDINYIQEDYG